jgi:hypothetical protein
VELREIGAQELVGGAFKDFIASPGSRLSSEDQIDHLWDQSCFIAARSAIWDMNFDDAIVTECGDASFTAARTNHSKLWQ